VQVDGTRDLHSELTAPASELDAQAQNDDDDVRAADPPLAPTSDRTGRTRAGSFRTARPSRTMKRGREKSLRER
jgi:hypothetical protein